MPWRQDEIRDSVTASSRWKHSQTKPRPVLHPVSHKQGGKKRERTMSRLCLVRSEMTWRLWIQWWLFLKVPLGRGAWAGWCSSQRALKLGQISPLSYLGNDNISAFTYRVQAWKREGESQNLKVKQVETVPQTTQMWKQLDECIHSSLTEDFVTNEDIIMKCDNLELGGVGKVLSSNHSNKDNRWEEA